MSYVFSLALMLLLLFAPSRGSSAALQALKIWGLDLLPSLFPYMVLCQTLTQAMTRSKRIPLPLPFFLGLLGGSPSASASLSVFAANRPSQRKQNLFLSALAGTISPMFFLGLASSWLSSSTIAVRLLLSQYIGALCAGGLFYLYASNNERNDRHSFSPQISNPPPDPISQSVQAVLNVGGCIVFYSTAAACFLPLFSFLPAGIPQVLHALLEISGGLHALSLCQIEQGLKEVLAAGLCGFGGISILNQNLLFLRSIGIEKRELLLISAARGLFSAITMVVLRLIP